MFSGLLWIISLAGLKEGYAQTIYASKACAIDLERDPNTGQITGCPNPTYFFDQDSTSNNWVWSFGDGQPPIGGMRNPTWYFQSTGTYTVSLFKTNQSGVQTRVTKEITVGAMPQQPLFNGQPSTDTTVCSGSPLTLNPFGLTNPTLNNYDYLWFPGGDTTKTITVDSSGCYSVEVFDKVTRCSRTAKITVNFCYEPASSGGGNERWYFGNGATLEFQGTGEVAERDSLAESGSVFGEAEQDSVVYQPIPGGSNPLNTNSATAMVYGPSGALAFYTDGVNIYDGNDEQILDSLGLGTLSGNNTASQAVAIVPKSNCNECPHHQYYVFTKDKDTGLLSYSVIDLRYNEGLGMITERNVPVAYDIADKLAVRSVNDGAGFELITHSENGSEFQFMTLDTLGLITRRQTLGAPYANEESQNGYLVYSTDQELLAQGVVINGQNYVQIFAYDPDTQQWSQINSIELGISAPPSVYGLSFNEDNRFLYATISGNPSAGETSYLLQIPLFLVDDATISSEIEIISSSTTDQYGAIQLGPQNPQAPRGKQLYMVVNGGSQIAYIQEPDFQGGPAAVGFIDVANGVDLNGTSGLGLPTVAYAAQNQEGGGVSATYFGNCFNSTTALETQNICDPMRNEVLWEFEDGTTMKGQNVNYTFPKLGWNKIKATITVYNTSQVKRVIDNAILNQIINLTETECTEIVLEDSIYIKPSPEISLTPPFYVCLRDNPVDPVVIDPDVTGGDTFEYLWQTSLGVPLTVGPRDTAQYIQIPDTYLLDVENNFECSTQETVLVESGCIPDTQFPTAFTPGGMNPTFSFYYKHTDNPNLKIYNRWGEIVFETNNLDTTWNGTLKGSPVPTGVYAYVLTYDAIDFPEWGRQKEVGSVWILR
ncbi:hypothetical protein AFM12_07915 [Jiulongibacter sediminis]|uniref:PKD domain-containing protein n=2 Tax=Jiulongibacter sediminis TaxID=1605367 RepID=A0A0P7C5F7_9BACT|nr:hypothetical protein AFM12_07915 [Jiulongibacter sediminis]TBX25076.1 hypothetical protein TK44_07920 [Jiulongibacter sediminis]